LSFNRAGAVAWAWPAGHHAVLAPTREGMSAPARIRLQPCWRHADGPTTQPRACCKPHHLQEDPMLKWAIIFAVISLIAGVFGFTGVASGAAGIAKILFYIFVVIAVIFIVLTVLGVGAVV
jgi:uncharacterized membrane protein YtjA (UPF0391 family)